MTAAFVPALSLTSLGSCGAITSSLQGSRAPTGRGPRLGRKLAMVLPRLVNIVRTAAERTRPVRRFGLSFGVKTRTDFYLSPAEISTIDSLMRDIRPEDVGISPEAMPSEIPSTLDSFITPPISYIHVAENDDLLMAIFVMPPGSTIPTHSHPSTYVFTRVLTGELAVREFDFLSPPTKSEWGRRHPAIERPLSVTAAGDARYLTPSSGNVHCFQTMSWTAVFDLILPPYSSPDRVCRYYTAVEPSGRNRAEPQEGVEKEVLLQEIHCPDNYATRSLPYTGVPVRLY